MSPLPNDPNGVPWEEYGYTSYEAFIESKAGANPPEYDPLIPASIWREEDDFPTSVGQPSVDPTETASELDWPQEKPPPFAADDEDDEAPDE